jgi:hypothetical protein
MSSSGEPIECEDQEDDHDGQGRGHDRRQTPCLKVRPAEEPHDLASLRPQEDEPRAEHEMQHRHEETAVRPKD